MTRLSPLRVLIAEDSATARALLVAILRSDPGIEIVGEARDGEEAVSMTVELKPDLVTMDVAMPRLDGFEATKRIMAEAPTPIVIVSSVVDVHAVDTGLQALRAGALSVLAKPAGPQSPDFAESCKQLLSTIKAMAGVKVVRRRFDILPGHPVPVAKPGRAMTSRVVALAASTGGPGALQRVLGGLPANFPLPILIIQHIARGFIDGLATWLDDASPLKVKVAEAGEMALPGVVYVGAEDRHLGITAKGNIVLSEDPPIGGFRPSASYLFHSVAMAYGTSVISVILTGMGQDGMSGMRAIRERRGTVIAQDEATSIVFGMPKAVIEAGLADHVLPLSAIGPWLADAVVRA